MQLTFYVRWTEPGTHGKIGGDVKVAPGVSVKLFTKIGRNLIIEPDVVVEFPGVIGYDAINRGGSERYEVKRLIRAA